MGACRNNTPVRVGWVAGRTTAERLAAILRPLATGLVEEGVRLSLFCPPTVDGSFLAIEAGQIYRSRCRFRRPGRRKAVAQWIEEARAARIDVFHALEACVAPTAAALGEALELPYVVSCYRLGQSFPTRRGPGRLWAVLAGSEPIRQDLHTRRIADARVLHLLRPAVPLAGKGKMLEPGGNGVAILADVRGGRATLREAVMNGLGQLHRGGLGGPFFLMTDGRHEKTMQTLTDRRALRCDLTVIGPQSPERTMHIVQSAGVFVSAVARATLDVLSLVAMAAGVPVLAAAGGPDDFLQAGRTAMRFSTADSGELAHHLIDLLQNVDQTNERTRQAMQYVQVFHNPVHYAAQTARIYRQAAAGNSHPQAEPKNE